MILLSVGFTYASDLPRLASGAEKWLQGRPAAEINQPKLLFVFTRDCGNCHRSHAFLNTMQKKYGKKIQIIGVHSPEFIWEKNPEKLSAYAQGQGIEYPVYLDTDMKVWNALENQYWPAFHLFDRTGRRLHLFVGETHLDDNNARQIEAAIVSVAK